jgi:predicted MFS family arabinose efflux permease
VIFFLVLFLQQVAGYDALQAGISTLPITIVMFALSRRAGRLADRFGPRWFMGFGPIVSAAGLALLQRVDADVDYVTELLPAILLFALGLSATVAPLTATVLADADEHNAGIASGVNNAIARVAGLLAVAALGAVVAAQFTSAIDSNLASVSAFHTGVGIAAALVALGGALGLVGIRNPRRSVPCAECPGGQFAGAPQDAARPRRAALPATT